MEMFAARHLLCATLYLTQLDFVVAAHHEHHDENRDLKVLYGTSVTLTCSDSHHHPHAGLSYQWLLPSGDLLDTTKSNASDHYSLTNNGTELVVSAVDRPQFGHYMCFMLETTTTHGKVHYVVHWSINVDGPYYGDMWVKYWPHAQVGLIAGAAVFVVMGLLCLNMEQFDSRHDKPDPEVRLRSEVRLQPFIPDRGSSTYNAYGNPVFIEEVTHNTFRPEDMGEKDKGDVYENHSQNDEREPKTSF